MGADITAFIQIDDNTHRDEPPFTCHPSTWDLSHDIGLAGGKHYEFYAAISGVRNRSSREPLYAKAEASLVTTAKTPEQNLAELLRLIAVPDNRITRRSA